MSAADAQFRAGFDLGQKRAQHEMDAAMALGRLVLAIYIDPTAPDWLRQAPAYVVHALTAAQELTGISYDGPGKP